MTATAKLTVTHGTERGKVFVLNGEMAHIGRGNDNQIILSDPDLAEHQASIVHRNGRFAIYVSGERSLALNGRTLPPEQWIWLPGEASLQLTPRTTLQFQSSSDGSAEPPKTAPELESVPAMKKGERRRAGKKGEAAGRVVARFITDRTGETLVRLGEDGQLPELSLSEGETKGKGSSAAGTKGSPALAYAALGFSLLASVALLVLEPENPTQTGKAAARQIILREFVGREGEPLKPYQQLLREAELAYSRGDRKEEREAYQAVLRLLNSEDRNPLTGVTGNVEDDERLRKLIAILMGSG